jgi:hypothetical protein
MIRYDLTCDKGHAFDGWFSNSEAYDVQAARGLVECSVCGSIHVEKQLMAPGIPAKSNRKVDVAPVMAGPVDPRMQQMMAMMREVRAHVEKNAEHVGDRFADEARKIHYGEAEDRGIYGNATHEQTRALLEEGIEVHPLPKLPEDRN